MNCKNKSFMTKRKAFTLIELLIVIAIIGILFIVLVSKVDFATDKAKATGVQTDFRSFQLAFDTVAKENAGFTSLITTDYERLEAAINKHLDSALKVDIDAMGNISMVDGTTDPWNVPYHGNVVVGQDGKDRGAVIMYSNGPDMQFGSNATIVSGVASIAVNDAGKDDYAIVSCYTYVNGYGEVKNVTTGFSNNQTFDVNVSNENSDDLDIPEDEPEDTLVSTKYNHINGIFMIDPSVYFESDMILELAPDRETYRDLILNENYEVSLTNVLVVNNGVVTMTQGWYYPATKLIIPLTDEGHAETMTLDDLENSYQSAGMSINISSTSISINMGFGVGDFNIVNNMQTIDEVQGFNIRVTDNSYWISEALAVWYDSDEHPTNNSYVMKSENTWSIYLDEDDFWEFDGMFFTNARIELNDDYFNTNWVPEGVCYPTAYSTNTQSIVFIPYF